MLDRAHEIPGYVDAVPEGLDCVQFLHSRLGFMSMKIHIGAFNGIVERNLPVVADQCLPT